MASCLMYKGNKAESFEDLIVKIDYVIKVEPKKALFFVDGYDAECSIHLNDNELINVMVSTCIKYNFLISADQEQNRKALELQTSPQVPYSNDCLDTKNFKPNLNECSAKTDDKVNCPFCKKQYPTQKHLQTHIEAAENVYACIYCKTKFDAKCQLLEHTSNCLYCKFCNQNFTNKSDYSQHMSENKPSVYLCNLCSISFSTKCAFNQHKEIKCTNSVLRERCISPYEKSHSNLCESNNCINCDKEMSLETHCYCKDCKVKFNDKHITKKMSEGSFICNDASMTESSENENHYISKEGLNDENLQPSIFINTNTSKFFCKTCKLKFDDNNLLQEHLNTHTEHKCDICSKTFKTGMNLTNHKKTHQRSTTCDICYKSFGDYYKLNQHMKNHAVDKKYMCSTCGKTFKLQNNLRTHMASHSNERPYGCKECNKTFKTKSAEIMHRKIHLGLKPFQCETCDKRFTTKSALRLHLQLHSNLKPFECTACEKKFFRKDHLQLHVKSHTGKPPVPSVAKIKQFQCETCGKAFTTKRILIVHMRTHTGERPFKCNECDKRFAQRNALIYHTRMHSGIKPFKCETCVKAFHLKWQLVDHNRVHTGERPFKCSKCDISFSVRSNLARHSKIHQ